MTARQAAKAFPIDEELHARLKALQDSGFEPYIDDEHPDLPDDESQIVRLSMFNCIFPSLKIPKISLFFAKIAEYIRKNPIYGKNELIKPQHNR